MYAILRNIKVIILKWYYCKDVNGLTMSKVEFFLFHTNSKSKNEETTFGTVLCIFIILHRVSKVQLIILIWRSFDGLFSVLFIFIFNFFFHFTASREVVKKAAIIDVIIFLWVRNITQERNQRELYIVLLPLLLFMFF